MVSSSNMQTYLVLQFKAYANLDHTPKFVFEMAVEQLLATSRSKGSNKKFLVNFNLTLLKYL